MVVFQSKKYCQPCSSDNKNLDYKLLEISNGGLASSAYKKLRNQSEEEVTHIRTELFKYCSLDTYAMYAIYKKLLNLVLKGINKTCT